jgi:stage II sporulation protein D
VRWLATVAALAAAAFAGCTSPSPRYTQQSAGDAPTIRALLDQVDGGEIVVNANGPFSVRAGTGASVARHGASATVRIRRDGGSLQLRLEPGGNSAVVEGQMVLVPESATSFAIGGVTYSGRIVVYGYGHSSMLLINLLDLETYLEGVVPHEIGDPGPEAHAAVQAQAVAARTYAISRVAERRAEPFDVFAGVRDQVYRGRQGANPLSTAAVRETRGVILENGGALARTYYSATCGGHTADIRRVWPQRESAPYLRGVYDRDGGGSYCAWVRNFRWRFSFSGRELGVMLRRTIPRELGVPADRVGFLVALRVVERSPSGRVRVLDIETTSDTFRVEGDRIRWVLMADVDAGTILPSTMFKIEQVTRGGRVTEASIIGGGNGHGVGMCQNGAIGMARKGNTYERVLAHYYPGTKLVRRY